MPLFVFLPFTFKRLLRCIRASVRSMVYSFQFSSIGFYTFTLGKLSFPRVDPHHSPYRSHLLKLRSAQKKNVGLIVGSSKRPWVQSTAIDVHAKESPVDPIATVADDGEWGTCWQRSCGAHRSSSFHSSCYDRNLYDNSSSSWTAFRWAYCWGRYFESGFSEYRSAFPLPPPFDSWWLPLTIHNRLGK